MGDAAHKKHAAAKIEATKQAAKGKTFSAKPHAKHAARRLTARLPPPARRVTRASNALVRSRPSPDKNVDYYIFIGTDLG